MHLLRYSCSDGAKPYLEQNMEVLINPNQFAIVELHPEKLSEKYKWYNEEKKFFGLIIEPAGFYKKLESFSGRVTHKAELVTVDDILKEGFYNIIHNTKMCYVKPYARLQTPTGKTVDTYFDTNEELEDFALKFETNTKMWVRIQA